MKPQTNYIFVGLCLAALFGILSSRAATPPSGTITTASNLYMNVVNEWKISSTNANVADPSFRRAIISFGKNAQTHNGGTCSFGPDGYLYLALGDGGNANDAGNSHIVPGSTATNQVVVPIGLANGSAFCRLALP